MPSKALLRSGHALHAAQRVGGAREAVTGAVDPAAVLARRNEFTSDWHDDGQVAWLDSAGIELIRGRARLTGRGRVQIGERSYSARAVALATGSVSVLPDIPGLAGAAPWSTREATAATAVPPRLIVVGGGVAGTELAFAFASLGSQVTVLSRSPLLKQEEPFVGERLAAALADEGVDLRVGVTPARVDRDAEGIVSVALPDGDRLQAEEILVATGRRPNLDHLGLETIGIDVGEAGLTVDDTMLVAGTDWLYAAGDVNGRALLTHQGKYQARAAGEAIAARLHGTPLSEGAWGRHVATADHRAVPRVVFSDPEVASVGLTEARAREAGIDVRTLEADFASVAGAALHADGYAGRAKLVIDGARDVVIGATFVGQDVAELLHAASIAIVGEVRIDRLWHAVPAYPTLSEIWLRLLEAQEPR